MKRAQRLREFWSWLPAFRVVAESEHLPTASKQLGVSVPALSRTVRQLEVALGVSLFDRRGRSLVLNDRGRHLMQATRHAMRLVDDAYEVVTATSLAGQVTIAIPGPFAPLVALPAVAAVQADYPGIVAHLVAQTGPRVVAQLTRGQIDIAINDEEPPANDDLAIVRLGVLAHGVWARPEHPLHPRCGASCPPEAVTDHAFVAPMRLADGTTPDKWPVEVPRRIAVRVTQMFAGIDAALTSDLLVVLPNAVAERTGLQRLPVEGIGASTLFMVRRRTLSVPDGSDSKAAPPAGRIDAVVGAIERVAAGCDWT